MNARTPAALALVCVLTGGCQVPTGEPSGGAGDRQGREVTSPGATAPTPPRSPVEARALLDALPRTERRPSGLPAYDRGAFGSPWLDADDNGCNQRDDVLLRDAVPGTAIVQRQGACAHDVLGGTWLDPYTGAALVLDDLKDPRQAQAIQIDHVVPLAEAWLSGAATWDDQRRSAYATDLASLLAVDGPTNASKGADDPAAWRPRQAFQCSYAVAWVTTKHTWRLGVDTSEAAALEEMLATC